MVCKTSDDTLFRSPDAAKRGVLRPVFVFTLVAGTLVVLVDWFLARIMGITFNFTAWDLTEDLLFVCLTAALLYVMLNRRAQAQAVHDKTFSIISEQAKDGIILCDQALRILYINPATQKISGYSAEELIGHPIAELLSERYATLLDAHIAALERHPFIRQKWDIRHKDGWRVHIEVTTQRLPDGKYLAIGSDLTETRQAQKNVATERQRLHTLIRSLPDPVWLKDTTGAYIACNPALEKLFGLPAEQILNRTDRDIWPASDLQGFDKTDLPAGSTAALFSFGQNYRHADGTISHFETSKNPVYGSHGELIGMVGIARDVTAARNALDSLAASERRFHTLFDTASDMICVNNLTDARFIDVNRCACESLGYAREELLTMCVMDIHEGLTLEALQKQWASPEFIQGITRRGLGRRKDGSTFPVEVRVNRFETDGQAMAIAIVRNFSAQQQAEDALRASNEFNRAVLDASSSQQAVVDKSGIVVAVNDAWRRFSRENSDVSVDQRRVGIGSNFFAACRQREDPYADQARAAEAGVHAVLNGGMARFSMEIVCATETRELWFMMAVTPLKLSDGGAVINYTDISDIKHAQKLQAQYTRQLQALARMHQGIQERERHHLSMELHDQIGQSLAALKISLANTKRHLDDPLKTSAVLDSSQKIVDEIAHTTGNIVHRLRPPLLDDLGVRSALALHVTNLALPPEVKVQFKENLGALRFSEASELACFRIVQEAITNALRHAEATEINVDIACTPDQICLSVQDNGKGFTANILPDVDDERISLGLIGIRERVASLSGEYEINSQPNTGTRISACLPRTTRT